MQEFDWMQKFDQGLRPSELSLNDQGKLDRGVWIHSWCWAEAKSLLHYSPSLLPPLRPVTKCNSAFPLLT